MAFKKKKTLHLAHPLSLSPLLFFFPFVLPLNDVKNSLAAVLPLFFLSWLVFFSDHLSLIHNNPQHVSPSNITMESCTSLSNCSPKEEERNGTIILNYFSSQFSYSNACNSSHKPDRTISI